MLVQVLTVEQHLPAGRRLQATDRIEEGGLPRSAGAEDPHQLAAADAHQDVPQDRLARTRGADLAGQPEHVDADRRAVQVGAQLALLELEDEGAHLDPVVVVEVRGLPDPLAIDEGPVGRSQVGDHVAVGPVVDASVAAGDQDVIQDQVALGVAADDHRPTLVDVGGADLHLLAEGVPVDQLPRPVVAEGDPVPLLEGVGGRDPFAIDEGAVGAFQVMDHGAAVVLDADHRVLDADAAVVQTDLVAHPVAADGDLVERRQLEGLDAEALHQELEVTPADHVHADERRLGRVLRELAQVGHRELGAVQGLGGRGLAAPGGDEQRGGGHVRAGVRIRVVPGLVPEDEADQAPLGTAETEFVQGLQEPLVDTLAVEPRPVDAAEIAQQVAAALLVHDGRVLAPHLHVGDPHGRTLAAADDRLVGGQAFLTALFGPLEHGVHAISLRAPSV